MGAALAGSPLGDAERLLWLVRHLQPAEFARTFRRGLADTELMQVISALPAERRRALTERARPPSGPNEVRAVPDRRADRPLATAIRTARQQAQMSQQQLARLIGVRQSTVSQWERGVTEPSGLHMAALLGVLSGLTDLLGTQAAPTARGQPPRTRAS
jgi:DNA-binding XRE family transcriptional regulator